MLFISYLIDNHFPDGGASANRHIAIAKGLSSLRNNCKVFILRLQRIKAKHPLTL